MTRQEDEKGWQTVETVEGTEERLGKRDGEETGNGEKRKKGKEDRLGGMMRRQGGLEREQD